MGGNFQLAQISSSNLSLAERQVELERPGATSSASRPRSLDALLARRATPR